MKTLIAFEHPDEPGFGDRLLVLLEKVRPALVTVRLATAADHAEALGLDAEKFRWATVELQNGHARDPMPRCVDDEYAWNEKMLPWVDAARRASESQEARKP